MPDKKTFRKKYFITVILLFLILLQPLFSANVLAKPRKMYVVKTAHFEIIYPEMCVETAELIYSASEEIFERNAGRLSEELGLNIDSSVFMPVIISPDSDVPEVKYTAFPYNRIVIFDAAKDYDTAIFSDAMLAQFSREVYLALLQSVRSPFNRFVSKYLAGDSYQPLSLFNLPYSFVEGAAYAAGTDFGNQLDDGFFLQILSQAKLEGAFPEWLQISAVIDVYPGEKLALAAGSGFAAYLLGTYGIEKYSELWTECGKLNPMLTKGIFFRVYGKTLDELWDSFKEAVPLPVQTVKDSAELYPADKNACYDHLLLSDYGFVWYDRIRHEVDIFDENNFLKIRQLLFLADKVERMSLSPDGRLLSVSHTQSRTKEGLSTCSTWIYDLKNRRFLDEKFELRDAAVVISSDGNYALAGVNISEAEPRLQVYRFSAEKKSKRSKKEKASKLIFEKKFTRSSVPFSPVYGGKGSILYLIDRGFSQTLCRSCFDREESPETYWEISGKKRIRKLQYQRRERIHTFEYAEPASDSFTRAGIIRLEQEDRACFSFFKENFSGGTNNPVIDEGIFYYCAEKLFASQLRFIELNKLEFEEEVLEATSCVQETARKNTSDFYSLIPGTYNPVRYMLDFSFTPFFPVKLLDLNEGLLYWPGLGLSVETQADPCLSTRAVFSAGWTYFPLDFSWTKNIPSGYLERLRNASVPSSKDKSFAAYIENSSTPVNIKAGALLNYNLSGEYDFTFLAGTQWKIPLGIALRSLNCNIQSSYTASTDYYDKTLAEKHPSLSGWPSFQNAYEIFELSASVEYSNIHQYGWSPFEKRGFSLGARLFSMWDMYEERLLRKAVDEKQVEQGLTQAQKEKLLNESMLEITQLNLGLFGTIEIPRLTPFNSRKGWILSAPAKITAEFMNKAGTALEARGQILILGREIHDGFSPVYLYIRRVGLSAGYGMSLNYNTSEVRLPDIRRKNYLAEVFSDISYSDAVFMVLNLDFNIAAGKLSRIPVNTAVTGTFFPAARGYALSLDIRLRL